MRREAPDSRQSGGLLATKGDLMEKAYYWLGRKRAYLKAARAVTSSEARFIHSELARRYNVNAFTRATSAIDLEGGQFPASAPTPRKGQGCDID